MWTCVERMGSGLGTSLSPREHIIHVTALQPLFVHVWVWYIIICPVMHPVRLSITLDEILTCQALCTVPTKRRVLCQPSAVYCAKQALYTVPNKRHFLRISGHGGSHAHVEAKGPSAVPELVFRQVGKPAAKKATAVFVIKIRLNTRKTASPSKRNFAYYELSAKSRLLSSRTIIPYALHEDIRTESISSVK